MRLLIIFCFICLITGCTPATRETSDTSPRNLEQQAQDLLLAGNYTAAAEEYIRLADTNKSNTETFLLKAADAYISGNESVQAELIIGKLGEDKLTALQITERAILLARIAISNNDALTAINKLDITLPPESPRSLLAAYFKTRATALEMDNQFLNAARARIELNHYLDIPDELAANNQSVWDMLLQVNVSALEQEFAVAVNNAVLASWLELAIISRTMIYNPPELQTALLSWQQRYPNHPANSDILNQISVMAAQSTSQPAHIALLLPFSAQYKDASNAIRDGFLAAWYQAPADKPVIKIYNTNNQDILDIYQTAVTDGADFIVGPLEKEAIATLITSGNIPVKTLALNQVSDADLKNSPAIHKPAALLFQFGLLPEDETYHVAERAWLDGHANALIITLDTSWGDRILNAFSSHWTKLGGQIIEHVKIPMNLKDFSMPIKQLLNIDNSEQRTKQLTATLRRNIISEPRHRQDADIIFLAVTPLIAQQLVPQLRYYRADIIPTYSISSIYTGKFDPETNSDINNVIFSDMPWVIDPEHEYSPLQQSLNKAWGQSESPYRRLYAFGIDAYRIIPDIGRLHAQSGSFQGETGILKITPEGYIQRQSVWAKFVDGSPQLLDSAYSQ